MTRGRDATRPTQMPKAGWLDIGARVLSRVGALHVGLIAAGIAFYALLAIFPGITAAVAIVGLVYDPTILVEESGWLLVALPEAARTLIADQLAEVAGAESGSLGLAALLSLGIALWSSSNATGSFIEGLNVINGETETRGFVKLKLLTIGLTVAILIGLSISVVVVAAIPAFFSLFDDAPMLRDMALVLRWPLMFLIGVFGIAVLYRYGPDRRAARWRWLTPGAVIGCGLWVLGTFGFSYYVQNFASYNETFGALAGVIILLTWLWLSAFVVLLGAQLDAELEAQTARDSTVGPDRPMGERGAVKADTLGKTREEREDHGSGARDKEARREEPNSFAAR